MNGRITMKKRLGDDGEWIEYAVYTIDGKEVTEAEFLAIWPDKDIVGIMTTPPGNYPHESLGVGVHPRQVVAAMEHAKKVGVPTDFTADGKAIMRDRGHRRDYLKAMGAHDNNAYGRV